LGTPGGEIPPGDSTFSTCRAFATHFCFTPSRALTRVEIIEQAKGRKDRHVMLSPEMLGLLREWWKARPMRCDAGVPPEERLLFPGRKPGKPMTPADEGLPALTTVNATSAMAA
jgi:integrase